MSEFRNYQTEEREKGMETMDGLITVEHLHKSYQISKRGKGIPGMLANLVAPKYEKKDAVKDISFQIAEGEMVGFIGPNGAGKSTTIKMLSGILHPDSGQILVDGKVPYRQRKQYVGNIGVVFGQKSQLQWDLPVIDSFELLKAIYRIPDQTYKRNLARFTEMLDMQEFLKQPVRQLSLGQRMRADIVAALLHDPKIVFFDEPTIGVDVVGKETIRTFIQELNAQDQITMLFTTHDMQDIEKTCKRLLIIDQGNKVYDGALSGIREMYGTTRTLDLELQIEVQVAPIPHVTISRPENSNPRKWQLQFDHHAVAVQELMGFLLATYPVRDLNISEPEIESIIRNIYGGRQPE